MKAPAIEIVGRAGVAASAASTMLRRGRVLLGALLLLALTPGLASARATEPDEWPTTPDRGPRSPKKIPWMTFSGDPNAPVYAEVPGHVAHGHGVVVVREQELTRRQRRLLRRAERKAEKAAMLRQKAGVHGPRHTHATLVVPVVPVVQAAPPAPPPRVVVERARPEVHVVRLEQRDGDDDCHGPEAAELKELEALEIAEIAEVAEVQAPVVIDVERLTADVERQVERAMRHAERAREHAERAGERAREQGERARERAERARERAMRDAERARSRR